MTSSLGPDGVDQDGEGDDLIVSCDRAGAKAAAAGRRPAGPPYTPPLAHWLLALGDQACGALALILAWLLLVERQLVRWGPVSVWHLCWIAPGPAVLVAWFAAHAWADLELQPALPTLVPGWVAAGATVGLLVAIACGVWLWALQPADAARAATAREAAGALGQVARLPVDLVQLARQVLDTLRVGHVWLPASSSAKGGVGVEAPRKEPPPCPPP